MVGVRFDSTRNIEDIRKLSEPQRQQQRERHQTKEVMNTAMAVHVRYKSWYISQPSCTKLTKFCVFYKTRMTVANFSYFHLELNTGVTYLA